MIALVPPPAPLALDDEIARAREYDQSVLADSTQAAYASDLRHFRTWADQRGLETLPANPATLKLYVAWLADNGYALATIGRRLVAIGWLHKEARIEPSPTAHPEVARTVRGIARAIGAKQNGRAPLLDTDVAAIVKNLGATPSAIRDRALLTVAVASAMRRSELCALTFDDVRFVEEGAVLELRRSKTDQRGEGRSVPIVFGRHPKCCPVRALRALFDALAVDGITSGAIFRPMLRGQHFDPTRPLAPNSFRVLVKRYGAMIGLDPARLGGHSTRAGFITSALEAGATETSVMRVSGHKSRAIMDRYARSRDLFVDPAGAKLRW